MNSKNNIIAIDSAGSILNISLYKDCEITSIKGEGESSNNEELASLLKKILDDNSLSINDVNTILINKGPGSFTGLRVGMAGLKGISLASSAPLVSVPTLSVIEESVRSLWNGPVLSVIDAKKKKFYFRLSNKGKEIISDRDGNPEDVIEALKDLENVLVTGPDAALFASKILSISPELNITIDSEAPRCLSYALEKLGREKLEKEGPDDIGEGPVYIRRSDAEEMLLAKAKEAKGE